MALKKSSWNFQFGNKGIIFLLDIIIAAFLIMIVLTASIFFVSRAEEASISKLQASRIAHDIFSTLDYSDKLKTFDVALIQSEIEAFLPEAYGLDYKITCEGRVYDSRLTIPEEYILSGERIFIDQYLNNCIVRYWLWLR